jgi:hypothetical protein
MRYKGSCHCGKVAIEVEGEISGVISCNCSMCRRKGPLLWAVPRDQLKVVAQEDDLGRYSFNRHQIEHRFCLTCGIHPFAEQAASAYVNVRCLEVVNLEALEVIGFDGRSV